jgi:monofunctional biosynthetic peptidoglycan transglycosylase
VRRALLFLMLAGLLAPVLFVGSVVVYFPLVLWHGREPPRQTSLMEIRARDAARESLEWSPRYRWIPLAEISPHFVQSVLAAEDPDFYQHSGFDIDALAHAWETGDTRGTSTITQQTVKNLYLSPSRTVLRKLREAVLTWWSELCLSKDRILELYVNIVELGPGIFGVEAAAQAYFGTAASTLSKERAALLAATLPAPLVGNPASPSPGLRRRQRRILRWVDQLYPRVDVFSPEAEPRPGD